MTLPANIRINVKAPFPTLVIGSGMIFVQKANGIWTIAVNYTQLAALLQLSDLPSSLVVIYDPVTKQYNTVTAAQIAALGGGGGGGAIIPNIRKPASASTIAITTADVNVGIDTRTTPVTVNLPSAVSWYSSNPSILELTIVDYFANAGTNNITPSPAAGDVINYGSIVPVINRDLGVLRLRTDTSLTGWYVVGLN